MTIKRERRAGFPWFRVVFVLTFLGVVVFGAWYEMEARKVLVFVEGSSRGGSVGFVGRVGASRSFNGTGVRAVNEEIGGEVVEEEVAGLARAEARVFCYQVVIEKYPFSFASVKAKERLAEIELETGIIPNERAGVTFVEEYFDWFSSYVYYGFPFFACLICLVLLFVVLSLRLSLGRPMPLASFSFLGAGVLLLIQLVDSGVIGDGDAEMVSRLMRNPRWLFGASYSLIVIVMITILTLPSKKKIVEEVIGLDEYRV